MEQIQFCCVYLTVWETSLGEGAREAKEENTKWTEKNSCDLGFPNNSSQYQCVSYLFKSVFFKTCLKAKICGYVYIENKIGM